MENNSQSSPRHESPHDESLAIDEDEAKIWEEFQSGHYPKNNETMYAVNLVYQDKSREVLEKMGNLLQEGLEKEENLSRDKEMTENEVDVKELVRVPVLQYIPPYFRDSFGMAPRPNAEAIVKKMDNDLNPLVEPTKPWSKIERKNLLQAIQAALIETKMAPMKDERAGLVSRLETAGVGEHGVLTQQITKLDNMIVKMSDKVDISKQSPEVLQGLDWDKISATDMKGTRTPMECRLIFFNELDPKLNQEKEWGENELKRLAEIAEKNELRNWQATANELGTGRTAFQCFEKYQTTLNQALLKKEWDDEEDTKLREAVASYQMGVFIPWELVAGVMDGRTRAQCQNRWTRKLDPSLKAGRWDDAEDEVLKSAVKKYGVKGWRKIANEVSGRTEAQCRERWNSVLRGDIKSGEWTPDEDKLLLEGVATYGVGKWSKICTMLSGRTPNACKVRHRSLAKVNSPVKRGRKKVAKK